MKLTRYEGNPILKAHPTNEWENLIVCNPGAWYEDGKYYMLYRAAGDDEQHYVHLGLAESENGFDFKRVSDKPVFSPSADGPDAGCVEDPRIIKFGKDFYVTYAYRPFPPGKYWEMEPDQVQQYDVDVHAPYALRTNRTSTGLALSKNLKTFKRVGRLTKSTLDDRDAILFPELVNGKYAMLHRPKEWIGEDYGCEYPSIWLTFSDDMLVWEGLEEFLLLKGEQDWELKVGGSTPPLLVNKGWLTLYHGVDDDGIYRVGAVLLDKDDPTKILGRTKEPILEPEMPYELEGIYNGCVFPTGNVIVNGILYVYYGAADQYCCVATCKVNELIEHIMS